MPDAGTVMALCDVRCRIWLCDWQGPEQEWLAHRARAHPTAERVAREHAERLGREPKADETLTPSPVARLVAAVSHPSPSTVPAEAGSRPEPHCHWCGVKVRRGDVCHAHSDLPALEPIDEQAAVAA